MAHQIIRQIFRDQDDKGNPKACWGWGKQKLEVNTLKEIFDSHVNLMSQEPKKVNYYYTLNYHKSDKRPRAAGSFMYGKHLYWDLDSVDYNRLDEYIDAVLDVLLLKREQCTTVASGRGLHFIIELVDKYNETYINKHSKAYTVSCKMIMDRLDELNLPYKDVDPVFDRARIFRMPGTTNRKWDKAKKEWMEDVECYIIENNMVPIEYSLSHLMGLGDIGETDVLNPDAKQILFPNPDVPYILQECRALKFMQTNANEVSQTQWYNGLSTLYHLDNSGKLAHDISSKYNGYSREETDTKLLQVSAYGPVSCTKMHEKGWSEECESCPHWASGQDFPIKLKGNNHIATKDQGFRKIILKNDIPVPGAVEYGDLVKYFDQNFPYITINGSGTIFYYQDKHFKIANKTHLYNFVLKNVSPIDGDKLSKWQDAFIRWLSSDNIILSDDCFDPLGYLNLQNGVLRLKDRVLLEHDTEKFKFRYCLPYDYDPNALCPRYDKFMLEVMENDKQRVDILNEYGGYCISGDKCLAQKAAILSGGGRNGKSTWIHAISTVAGLENVSAVPLNDLNNPVSRQMIVGKLFNVAEETPMNSGKGGLDTFKTMVTGGQIPVRILYRDPYIYSNRAKFIFAANHMPKTMDDSKGLIRRMLIIPFTASFEGADEDKLIEDKLAAEAPGILNRLLDGYDRLVANDYEFTRSLTCEAAVSAYQRDIDSVLEWLGENYEVTFDQNDEVPRPLLYKDYIYYHQENNPGGSRYLLKSTTWAKKMKDILKIKGRFKRGLYEGVRVDIIPGIRARQD